MSAPGKKKLFCNAPWSLVTLGPNGNLTLCCFSADKPMGHISEVESLSEFFNSEKYNKVRKRLNSGQFPRQCHVCELRGDEAPRHQKFISKLPVDEGNLKNYNKKILALEFTGSNICNQNCATCGSRFSSRWIKDDKEAIEQGLSFRNESIYVDIKDRPTVEGAKGLEKILEILPNIELLTLKGGEPLADPSTKIILDTIIEKKIDCFITMTTNLTLVDDEWVERFKKLKEHTWLMIVVSVDGTGNLYEWIRGEKWEKLQHVLSIFEEKLKIPVQINITCSLYNFYSLPKDLMEINKLKLTKGVKFTIVKDPWYTSISLLSEKQLTTQIEKILNAARQCDNVQFLNIDEWKTVTPRYKEKNKKHALDWIDFLNKKRQHNVHDLVPQLKNELGVN